MTITNLGIIEWGGGRDQEMHRTYKVKFLIETTDMYDGPEAITSAPGLPAIGSQWFYGNDNDAYALCYPTLECDSVLKRETNLWWILSFTFSTRPIKTCCTTPITNPLSQPMSIGGSFVNYQKRVKRDRNSKNILSSSLEPIFVQKDCNRPTVVIGQTVLTLGLATFSPMIDTLNDATLWGLPKRCIKLRNVPWKRLVWGTCTFYYERTFEYDIRYETFDEKELVDCGHRWINPKLLENGGNPDRTNPDNFVRACDDRGNVNKLVLLDNNGERCENPTIHEHLRDPVELYNESNFLTLGMPATL